MFFLRIFHWNKKSNRKLIRNVRMENWNDERAGALKREHEILYLFISILDDRHIHWCISVKGWFFHFASILCIPFPPNKRQTRSSETESRKNSNDIPSISGNNKDTENLNSPGSIRNECSYIPWGSSLQQWE